MNFSVFCDKYTDACKIIIIKGYLLKLIKNKYSTLCSWRHQQGKQKPICFKYPHQISLWIIPTWFEIEIASWKVCVYVCEHCLPTATRNILKITYFLSFLLKLKQICVKNFTWLLRISNIINQIDILDIKKSKNAFDFPKN